MPGSWSHIASSPFWVPRIPKAISQEAQPAALSAPKGQRCVLEVAWNDVTSARALGWLPGNEASSLFHSGPPPLPRVQFHPRAIFSLSPFSWP